MSIFILSIGIARVCQRFHGNVPENKNNAQTPARAVYVRIDVNLRTICKWNLYISVQNHLSLCTHKIRSFESNESHTYSIHTPAHEFIYFYLYLRSLPFLCVYFCSQCENIQFINFGERNRRNGQMREVKNKTKIKKTALNK